MTIFPEEVAKDIHDTCVSYGDFTLSSGEKSNIYVDMRLFTFSHHCLKLFDLIFERLPLSNGLEVESFDAIGGPAIGAIPIASMMVTRLALDKVKMKSFAVRKVSKEHGKQNLIEGPVKKGDQVVVLEDVSTSGKSGLAAVQALCDHGCEVLQVITIVDRNQGAAELYNKNNVPFDRIFTIDDILIHKE